MSTAGGLQEDDASLRIIDPESAAQIARLFDQERVLLEAMGGLFAEQSEQEMSQIYDVLDVACLPGEWVLEVARTYPEMEVVGIDRNRSVIDYARAHARVRRLDNAHFYIMDILKPLPIAVDSFDLINISPLTGYIPTDYCLQLLNECKRILRPGGVMRLTDSDWGTSNTYAFETLCGMCVLAMQKAGQSFSPTGRTIAPLQMMAHLLRKAGFHNIRHKPYLLDFSTGSNAHERMCQSYRIMFKLAEPFLLETGVVRQEEFEKLYEQALIEMLSEDFCASWTIVTAWGQKQPVE